MTRLFRVTLPVTDIESATKFYALVLGTPGELVFPGRHYLDCGGTVLAVGVQVGRQHPRRQLEPDGLGNRCSP